MRSMRPVQLLVTKGCLVLLAMLLAPCLSVTFEDGTSGGRDTSEEPRGESFQIPKCKICKISRLEKSKAFLA